MIEVKEVSHAFSAKKRVVNALNKVSFSIERGEIAGLIGKSGSGKTTLARVIIGEIKPDSGTVEYDGKPLWNGKNRGKEFLTAQLIPQQPYLALDPTQAVGKGIAEILSVNKLAKGKTAKAMAIGLLEQVLLSKELYYRLPAQLSGGQVQRVVIARALALKPDLIISDEATSMLDPISEREIFDIFIKLASEGISVLLLSHDIELIKRTCDKIYVMTDGTIEKLNSEENSEQNKA